MSATEHLFANGHEICDRVLAIADELVRVLVVESGEEEDCSNLVEVVGDERLLLSARGSKDMSEACDILQLRHG